MSEDRVPYTGATQKLDAPIPYHVAVLETAESPEQARDLLAEACADYLKQRDELLKALQWMLIGVSSDPDGFGYRAKHGVDVIQKAYAAIARAEGRSA